MTGNELASRVTIDGGIAIVGAALLAAWLGGLPALLGVAAAGSLTLVNFRWLARSVSATVTAVAGHRPRLGWTLAVGLRFLAMFGALAALLVTGWVAPLGLMAGLAVLPAVLIVRGLTAARAAR